MYPQAIAFLSDSHGYTINDYAAPLLQNEIEMTIPTTRISSIFYIQKHSSVKFKNLKHIECVLEYAVN